MKKKNILDMMVVFKAKDKATRKSVYLILEGKCYHIFSVLNIQCVKKTKKKQ